MRARCGWTDGPPAGPSAAEARTLCGHLRRFRDAGTAIVYVSHRLDEVFALADEVTVLRDGKRVWHGAIGETSPGDLIQKMVGREISGQWAVGSGQKERGAAARFRCEGITASDGACADVALEVCGGEVVGLYGLI